MWKLTAAVTAVLMFAALAPAQPGKSAGGKKMDSCGLVTRADVEQASGQTTADPQPSSQNAAMCDFPVGQQGKIRLMLMTVTPSETPEISIAQLRRDKIAVTEVKGIGRRAFYADHGGGMTQLNAYKGSNLVILTLLIPGASDTRQKIIAEALMAKALAKL